MFRRIAASFLFLLLQILAIVLAPAPLVADDNGGSGFTGVVQSLPQGGAVGDWKVSGTTVHVSATTEIDAENGLIAVGACVEVEGMLLADSSIAASQVKTEEADKCNSIVPPAPNPTSFSGSIQMLPTGGLVGDWTVSGKTVHVAASTQINQQRGPASVGACVEVQGTMNADASITAAEIQVESASGGCLPPPPNQEQEVEIFGVVQSLPAMGALIGNWMVSGRTVQVSATTELENENPIVVGACVKVEGQLASDGSVIASKIEANADSSSCQTGVPRPEEVKFLGMVQTLPQSGLVGDWMVGNRTVHVTTSTEIETEQGAIASGSCVEVEGQLQSDSSILASDIRNEDSSLCAASSQGTFELEGIIDSIPAGGGVGDWKIAGQTVQVTASTILDTEHGTPMVGSCVEVRGAMQAGGVLVAAEIESRSSSGVCLAREGLVSAASLLGASVAPGEVVSLFGFNLGPASPHSLEVETDDKISSALANVHVFFDGVPAPLLFVSSSQINALVPFSVAGKNTTAVQIENNGAWSDSVAVGVTPSAPSIFTMTQSGKGQGAVLNVEAESGSVSVNGPANPAVQGSFITMFATGAGQTDPPGDDGQVTGTSQFPRPLLPVSVTIGGKNAEVQFAGAAPVMVAGVLQVNVRIPDDAPQGAAVAVVLTVGAQHSQDGVTIAIR
jgi:uncharacterized protein (TIGR03437 family)